MVFQIKVGVFDKTQTTGEQAITGIGFYPGLVMLHSTASELGYIQGDRTTIFGFASNVDLPEKPADETIEQASFATYSIDDATPSRVWTSTHNRAVWSASTIVSGFTEVAIMKRFNDDGFVLDWQRNDTLSGSIAYTVFGANANVATFDTKAATGNQTVNGVGFKPSFVFVLATAMPTTVTDVSDTTPGQVVVSGYGSYSFGMFNNLGEQAVLSCVSQNGVSTTATSRHQRTDKCISIYDPENVSGVLDEAVFISNNLDGFTVNWTTATTGVYRRCIFAAYEGFSSKIGTFSSPTSGIVPIVSQSVSGIGFPPRAVMFMGTGETV